MRILEVHLKTAAVCLDDSGHMHCQDRGCSWVFNPSSLVLFYDTADAVEAVLGNGIV